MPNPKYDDDEWDRRLGRTPAWFGATKPELAPLLLSAAEQRRQRLAGGPVVVAAGGQDYNDQMRVFAALDRIHALAPITLLVHGGAMHIEAPELVGADRLTDWWARLRGVAIEMHPANQHLWGKAAEAMRLKQMAEMGAHACIVFPGGEAMERQAKRYGIAVWRPCG